MSDRSPWPATRSRTGLAALGLAVAIVASLARPSTARAGEPAELEAGGRHWRAVTAQGVVHVWVPPGYDPATAAIVVYVHGYWADVDLAWRAHHLPGQFARAEINALFIACPAPVAPDQPVRVPSLAWLLRTARGISGEPLPDGRVVAVAHSGGYRTLEAWLDNRGLDTIVLVDAAYGEVARFGAWVRGRRGRRLIDVGDDTRARTDAFHRWVRPTVALDDFPIDGGTLPPEVGRARIAYIRSSLGHMPLVTEGVALPLLLRSLWTAPLPSARWDQPLPPWPPELDAASPASDGAAAAAARDGAGPALPTGDAGPAGPIATGAAEPAARASR